MSLLEILVTLFILSVGLLGVAAILPLGNQALQEAIKADRSSTCGRAMMRQMKVRGWVDPRRWVATDGTNWRPVITPTVNGPVVPYASSYVIDPLFFGEQGPAGLAAKFPVGATPITAALDRVTIDVNPGPLSFPMPLGVANQHFVWHDDLLLPPPKDADDRPRQTMLWSNGEGSVWPPRLADGSSVVAGTDIPLKPEDVGNYTWIATVTPVIDRSNNDGDGRSAVHQITRYSVSIVVFYKRDLRWPENTDPDEPPAERSVAASMVGGGWGGGDVQLIVNTAMDARANAHWLNVRKDQWIMLRAVDRGADDGLGTPDDKVVAHWYRVIAVDPEVVPDVPPPAASAWSRYVTLSGPDWEVYGINVVSATLVENVIGVYTTTVEADLNSAWTR